MNLFSVQIATKIFKVNITHGHKLIQEHTKPYADIIKLNTPDILLGQFEKVSHTKSKWKCSLKDGIFSVNGRDVAFSRALGEFLWS